MTFIESRVLELIKLSLKNRIADDFQFASNKEIEEIYNESISQAVPLLTFSALPKLDCKEYSKFRDSVMNILTLNSFCFSLHIEVCDAFEKCNIPYCIIKGVSSAYYYPLPSYRSMGDIDLLVNECDFEKASKILIDIGFKRNERRYHHNHHITFTRNRRSVELHHSIGYKNETDRNLKDLTPEIINTSRIVNTDFGPVRIPSPFYHAVVMIFHIYHHLLGAGIGLRHICDWAVFADSKEYLDICDEFSEFAKEWRLFNLFGVLSSVSYKYFDVQNCNCTLSDTIVTNFMDTIMSSGNFGIKNKGTFQQYLVNKSFSVSENSFLKNFIQSAKITVYCRCPKSENNTFLFALVLLAQPFRYFYEFITKKRKMPNLRADIVKSKKTNKVLSDLFDNK